MRKSQFSHCPITRHPMSIVVLFSENIPEIPLPTFWDRRPADLLLGLCDLSSSMGVMPVDIIRLMATGKAYWPINTGSKRTTAARNHFFLHFEGSSYFVINAVSSKCVVTAVLSKGRSLLTSIDLRFVYSYCCNDVTEIGNSPPWKPIHNQILCFERSQVGSKIATVA